MSIASGARRAHRGSSRDSTFSAKPRQNDPGTLQLHGCCNAACSNAPPHRILYPLGSCNLLFPHALLCPYAPVMPAKPCSLFLFFLVSFQRFFNIIKTVVFPYFLHIASLFLRNSAFQLVNFISDDNIDTYDLSDLLVFCDQCFLCRSNIEPLCHTGCNKSFLDRQL